MSISELREKLYSAINLNISIENKDIYIFGAGNTALLYEQCFISENIRPKYYIDNNIDKVGKEINGAKIISLKDVADTATRTPVILICSAQYTVCREILNSSVTKRIGRFITLTNMFLPKTKKILCAPLIC